MSQAEMRVEVHMMEGWLLFLVHSGEEIGSGLLNKIIKDTGLSREQFSKLLENA
jgi:hypothetical protein